jgi:hypothetical protein
MASKKKSMTRKAPKAKANPFAGAKGAMPMEQGARPLPPWLKATKKK